MTLYELDEYFNTILKKENFIGDPSNNGIQVQNASPKEKKINKVAFAVDACLKTIEQAAKIKAQVLVVHHGLFWGHEQRIVEGHYKRIKTLLDNDIALFASHIPLDANNEVGNNYGIARKLGMENLAPFGTWHSMAIGVVGELEEAKECNEILSALLSKEQSPNCVWNFGKKDIKKIAVVSGGAGDLLEEAIKTDVDLFITGEVSHELYHTALENNINVIAAGHYNTETMGVCLLAEKLQREREIETVFIDFPTGL